MSKMHPWLKAALGACAAGWAVHHLNRQRRRLDFFQRVVVLTGGSRGLGLVLARKWAAEGARLAILARDPAELERAVAELSAAGAETLGLVCDVRSGTEVAAAIERVVARFGRLDVLVNVAGVIAVGPIEHMSLEDFEDSLDVHVWGPLHTIHAATPHMRRAGGGRIVNVSSIGGKVAIPHLVAYSTGKFALSGLSEGLHAELAKDGIYVTNICPGLLRTGSAEHAVIKGRHRQEFAWFAISDSLPLLTTSAESAAGKIIEACRYGDAQLIISLPAKALALMNALLPNFTADMLSLAHRLLPTPTGPEGTQPRSGQDSHSIWTQSWLTHLSRQAAARNNERGPNGRH